MSAVTISSSLSPERSGRGQVTKRALLERVIAEQGRYFDGATDALSRLQDRGLIKDDIDVRAFAAWFLGLSLSRLLSDIDPDLDPDTEWSEYTYTAPVAILTP